MASSIRVIPTPVGQGSSLIIPGSTTFERANSDYLSRTPSSGGNEKTFTISWWFRLTETPGTAGATGQSFFIATTIPAETENIQLYLSDDQFTVNTRHDGGSWTNTEPSRRFRDNSAWYHMVVAIDTTQSTGTDRLKIYINGELNSDWDADGRASITQNTDLNFNSTVTHCIGKQGTYSNVHGQFNMSDFYIIDGQALDASNFGYTDPLTNTWRPKKYSGDYNIASTSGSLYTQFSNTTLPVYSNEDGGSENSATWANFVNGDNTSYTNMTYLTDHWSKMTFQTAIANVTKIVIGYDGSGHCGYNGSASYHVGYAGSRQSVTLYNSSAITLTDLYFVSKSGMGVCYLYDCTVTVGGTDYELVFNPASGVNSCYLPLDGTGYSAFQTIGNMVQDQSGNQNNWTKNGSPTFSTDTPSGVALSIDNNAGITTTGVPTNYCILHNLNRNSNGDTTDGDLVWYRNGSWATILGTVGANTGKWYFEVTHNGGTSGQTQSVQIGIAQEDHSLVDNNPLGGSTIWRKGIGWISSTGSINSNGGHDGFGTWAENDTVGCAVDIDEKKIWFHKNGTWILSRGGTQPASGSIGDPALGTHPIFDPSSESSYAVGSDNGCNILPAVSSQYGRGRVNFGQTAFAYAPPKGFKPWCTANIPQTDLVRPDEYCKPLAVIGNGDTQKIEFGFQPDLLFVKPRTATTGGSWNITDSVRGGSVYLMTNSQNGNGSFSSPYGIAEWAEYGVTVKDQTNGDWNLNGNPGGTYSGTTGGYAYYGWKAGGNKNTFNINGVGYASAADAGITEGDISLTAASINTKDGFSIITYVGTGNNGDTVAHGLTKEPAFVIAKKYAADESGNWGVYHQGFTANTKSASLNLTNHEATPTDAFWTWSSTTTNLLGLGFNSITNDNTEPTIAYLWADVQGVQKFGSYTGNGAKKFVYLGFKPAIVLVKRIVANSSPDTSTSYTSWTWMDSARLSYNGMTPNHLFANHNEPEGYRGNGSATSGLTDMTMEPMSNGFYLNGPGSEVNASTGTYIYCAWAETPFQNLYGAQSNAR